MKHASALCDLKIAFGEGTIGQSFRTLTLSAIPVRTDEGDAWGLLATHALGDARIGTALSREDVVRLRAFLDCVLS